MAAYGIINSAANPGTGNDAHARQQRRPPPVISGERAKPCSDSEHWSDEHHAISAADLGSNNAQYQSDEQCRDAQRPHDCAHQQRQQHGNKHCAENVKQTMRARGLVADRRRQRAQGSLTLHTPRTTPWSDVPDILGNSRPGVVIRTG